MSWRWVIDVRDKKIRVDWRWLLLAIAAGTAVPLILARVLSPGWFYVLITVVVILGMVVDMLVRRQRGRNRRA